MNVISWKDELRARLIAERGQYSRIRESSGLTTSWLSKFASGAINNPTIENLDRLARALDALHQPKAA
jgi:transcriptional regulator with XRE-family HTH domain